MSTTHTASNQDPMKQTYQTDNFYNSDLGYADYYTQGMKGGSPDKQQKPQTPVQQDNQRGSVGHQPQQNHDLSNKIPNNPFSEEDRKLATYDPYWELKQGKSEKEVLAKLKGENSKLRSELKSVSEDLTMLLEKKKLKKNGRNSMPVKDIVKNEGKSDEVIKNELETAEKQLERLKKEMDSMKNKFESEGTFDNYEKLKDKIFEKEGKATKINQDKKNLEKAIRETEKTLQVLCGEAEYNVRINALEQEVRLEREKLREVEKHTELLIKQTENRKQAVTEIQNELKGVQSDMNKVSIKTKVQPNEIEKPKSERISTKPNLDKEPIKINKKVPVSKFIQDDEAAPPCTHDNFDKLKKEIKILQRADYTKENNVESKLSVLKEELEKLMKARDDSRQKVAEKSKEILILTTKSKDISRIVRHHAVAPLQREEREQHLKGSQIIPEVTIETGNKSRKNADKKQQQSPPPKEKQQAVGLTEYARQKFHTKGYRKDERGLLLKAGEGENWNDKDVCGKAKVKIIAIDIWHDDDVICGVQAVYEADKGDVIEGMPHVFNPEACKMTTFETLEEDYVKEISGFMNRKETVIECLILKTYRGDTMKVGKPSKDSKFFRYDINELEYPAILYGSNTQDESGRGRLTRLGVLISSQVIEEVIKPEVKEEEAEKKDTENNKTKEDDDHNKSLAKSIKSRRSDANRSKRDDSDDEDHNKSKSRHSKGSKNREDEEEEVEDELEDQEEQEEGEDEREVSGEAYEEEEVEEKA